MSLGACATWVQDAASRRAGLQNGNPRDYCTYKRFTVRGPFAEPKGDRGRYGNRQAEASTYPFYFPRCKPSAPPSLFASSDSVAPFYSLHLGTLSPPPPFFSSLSSYFSSVFLRRRCASSLFARSSDSQTSSRATALDDPVCCGSFRDGIFDEQKDE